MPPSPAASDHPVLVRLDCRRRGACLRGLARIGSQERQFSPSYLDCRQCTAYEVEPDREQRRADQAALAVLAAAVVRGLRRAS